MSDPDRLVRELESCSVALLEALRRRDAIYLEYLQRREQLLARLFGMVAPNTGPEARAALERVRILGNLAVVEAQRMRHAVATDLAALEQERRIAKGLREVCGPHSLSLDVRA